jgi:hypothetical protein
MLSDADHPRPAAAAPPASAPDARVVAGRLSSLVVALESVATLLRELQDDLLAAREAPAAAPRVGPRPAVAATPVGWAPGPAATFAVEPGRGAAGPGRPGVAVPSPAPLRPAPSGLAAHVYDPMSALRRVL